MKYLLIVVIVLAVLWLARSARRLPPGEGPRPAPRDDVRQPMLACAHCGLHMPRDEALPGRGGVFCSESHRTEYERAHPAP